jgi:hypothetical protein
MYVYDIYVYYMYVYDMYVYTKYKLLCDISIHEIWADS